MSWGKNKRINVSDLTGKELEVLQKVLKEDKIKASQVMKQILEEHLKKTDEIFGDFESKGGDK